MDSVLEYEIVEKITAKNATTFRANIDVQLLQRLSQSFDAGAASFWFRFFGEVNFHAQRFDGLTDVTFHIALTDEAREQRSLAAPVITRLSKREAWGDHVPLLDSPNVDAIYITSENLKADEVPRIPTKPEAERLAAIRAAFADMLDADNLDEGMQADLATRIVSDLLIGEFDSDARGAMATVVGVWVGDRVSELTGLKWHCIDEAETVSYCIHDPVRKVSCFPFDAMNKRLNAREAFQPHLLAETFAKALKSMPN